MTALARVTDPVTSHEAASRVDGAGSRQFVMFMAHEYGPLTDFQLVRLARRSRARWSDSRLRTARAELMTARYGSLLRWVEGVRGPSEKSRTGAQVWEVAA